MGALQESQKIVAERFTDLVDSWGLALAYAVTQSVELSEKIVTDAIVASIAASREDSLEASPRDELLSRSPVKPIASAKLPPSVQAVRFASIVWELARHQSYQPFGGGLAADLFFRLPALSRAVVVLKTRAQFSRHQIASALKLSILQVDQTLDHARAYFSDGRSWLQSSPGLVVEDRHWTPDCPRWLSSAEAEARPDLSGIFARFAGNDLDSKESRELQKHLGVCENCRVNFAHFRGQYQKWINSVPAVATGTDLKQHLRRVTKMALKLKNPARPSPWPGVRRLLRSTQTHLMPLGASLLLAVHWYISNSHRRH